MKGQAAVSKPLESPDPVALSIGVLSAATGVPVDTLRTWERRYGFPAPISRTGGSHRRYSADTVLLVQLIVRALELGHRPSAVVGRDAQTLRRMIALAAPTGEVALDSSLADARRVQRWLELSRRLEGEALTAAFHAALAEMPALTFLERCMGPYLAGIGELWARGQLRVSQEHFASETAREFLSTHWRARERPRYPGQASVVLATPPGEPHVLGLHMAAWAVALGGAQVIFLGADTPTAEVVFAVERHAANGVALSVAAGYPHDLARMLRELSRALPSQVAVAVGGDGTLALGEIEQKMNSLQALTLWAERLGVEAASRH
jgi:MerR family transcriptional regulator, light-induced transcriptional regulator